MAISRILGASLVSNLDRQGVDLQFTTSDTALVYMDFANFRLGINTPTPRQSLEVNGNILVANGHIVASANIASDIGQEDLWFSNIWANSIISHELTGTIQTSAQPSITSLGTLSNLSVGGDITANNISITGNIEIDGNLSALYVDSSAILGNILTADQPFIATLANITLENLNATGNILTQNFVANTASFNELAILQANISESLYVGNLLIENNTISSAGNIILDTQNTGIVQVTGTDALGIPSGTTIDRPDNPNLGYFRFNTDTNLLEIFDGTEWVSPGAATISSEIIVPDGVSNVYTLSTSATTDGVLVSINGTIQRPQLSYTVNDDQIYFSEIPVATDIIEVRHISTGVLTVSEIAGGNAKIALYSANVNITGNLIPETTLLYDIGSDDYRWRDLYLSGNTIYLGNSLIQTDGTDLLFVSETLVEPIKLNDQGVIVANVAPSAPTDGKLWWDITDQKLKVYYLDNEQWVDATPAGSTVLVSELPPESPEQGDLWWNNSAGQLKVYYIDTDGSQWVDASTGVQGDIGYTGSRGPIGYTGSFGNTGYTGSRGTIGYTGSRGIIGYTGSRGVDGQFGGASFYYEFVRETDVENIGQGHVLVNNSDYTSANIVAIHYLDRFDSNISTFIQTVDDSTSDIKGYLKITSEDDYLSFSIFGIIGSHYDHNDHFHIPVAYISGETTAPFEANANVIVSFIVNGDKGDQGPIGYTGSRGYTGSASTVQGPIGYTGSQGDQGPIGYTGSRGYTGSQGYTGSRGYTGSASTVQGPIGYTGSQGPIGYTGSASTVQGPIGYTGSQGPIGYTGSQGTQYTTSSSVQLGSLGIGTAASGTIGEIRATNEITAYYSSDLRLKENVVPISQALEKIRTLRGVMFDWTEEYIQSRGGNDDFFVRKHDTGVIAQEVEQVLPEVVAIRNDGYKAVRYEKLAGLIIQAINELADQVEQIKRNS